MKNKKILLSLLSLMGIVSPISFNSVEVDASALFNYEADYFLPIKSGEDLNIKVNIRYLGASNIYKDVTVRLYLYSNTMHNGTIPYHTKIFNYSSNLQKDQLLKIDYSLQDQFKLTSKGGIRCKLDIYSKANKKSIETIYFNIYGQESKSINPLTLPNNIYSLKNISAIDGSVYQEEFIFSGFKSKLELDQYLNLDLSSLSFIYNSPINFIYKNLYLSFYDKDNLFPNLSDTSNNVNIPLLINSNDNKYSLSFPTLYVDKKNLDLSLNYIEEYVSTKKFYLPVNKRKEIEEYIFKLHLDDLGVNSTDIIYSFSLDTSRSVLGSCYDSLYCIIGGKI